MKKSWSLSGNKEGFKLFIFHFSFDYLIDEWWGSMQAAYSSTLSTVGEEIHEGNHRIYTGHLPGQPLGIHRESTRQKVLRFGYCLMSS